MTVIRPTPGAIVSQSLPFTYLDDVVKIQLRASEYPYGRGLDGSGVQITLDQYGRTAAARLPGPQAQALALAMLATVDWDAEPASRGYPYVRAGLAVLLLVLAFAAGAASPW